MLLKSSGQLGAEDCDLPLDINLLLLDKLVMKINELERLHLKFP